MSETIAISGEEYNQLLQRLNDLAMENEQLKARIRILERPDYGPDPDASWG